ncbi:hypothetical protein ACVXHB_08035 [Escherichia coli]
MFLGILLASISKPAAEAVGLLGTLFVGALKAVAHPGVDAGDGIYC